MKRLISKWLVLVAAVAIAGCGAETRTTEEVAQAAQAAPMLNLSHIGCTDDGNVDVHFVLLFWGNSTPPSLNGTYDGGTSFGPVAENKHSGNVWHYDVILAAGVIDIQTASVGTVSLHNPDAYSGDYSSCGTPVCTAPEGLTAGPFCVANPLGSPGAECGAFGLLPVNKGDDHAGSV